jgi:CubicO group peptidase (beta-lactamase class C family)
VDLRHGGSRGGEAGGRRWLSSSGGCSRRGYSRETFAGRKANSLDDARIQELGAFIERGLEQLGVPGASLALVQGGKVVFAGGFGVKELGSRRSPTPARST